MSNSLFIKIQIIIHKISTEKFKFEIETYHLKEHGDARTDDLANTSHVLNLYTISTYFILHMKR